MTTTARRILALGLCVAFVSESRGIQRNADFAQGVDEIKALGGKAAVEEREGREVIVGADLRRAEVTDVELRHLTGLKTLESLDLAGTKVTDAGLQHCKDVTGHGYGTIVSISRCSATVYARTPTPIFQSLLKTQLLAI